jgi:peptide subunit release factor 1 (eRF1)
MDRRNLKQHLRTLAQLDETGDPVISAYLNLEAGETSAARALQEHARAARKTLLPHQRVPFDRALERIAAFVQSELFPEARGAALFAREGAAPFFLPLQFRVPQTDGLAADTAPHIYPLLELHDAHHRYVILISTETGARILEVNLGAVTEELWRIRPILRERVGREWNQEHYQNHRREQTHRLIKQKVKILEQLMAQGGHSHLVLAGNPFLCARVRAALPKHLHAKLIHTMVSANQDEIGKVVEATLSAFMEKQERSAHILVETLRREAHIGGLAVLGAEASLRAMAGGAADILVLARALPDTRSREQLVRTAQRHDVQIHLVTHSDELMDMGGVGCLLRYRQTHEPLFEYAPV